MKTKDMTDSAVTKLVKTGIPIKQAILTVAKKNGYELKNGKFEPNRRASCHFADS